MRRLQKGEGDVCIHSNIGRDGDMNGNILIGLGVMIQPHMGGAKCLRYYGQTAVVRWRLSTHLSEDKGLMRANEEG